ncbi:MAG: ABC transporter permease [Candidatus Dormibacteria bacterium]
MISRRSLVLARLSGRLLLSDPAPMIITIAMPLILAPFLVPAARAQLQLAGYPRASGADQIIPGLAVLFAFLSTQLVGTLFFREHAWGTWDRLRASPATTADIVLGKVAPLYVAQLAQLGVLLAAGWLLFGYRPDGSMEALAAVAVVFTAMLVAYAVMLVAICPTMDMALVLGNLGGMVMAGLGGALAPVSSLPQWAQVVAHLSPAYWALIAMRSITLDHAGLVNVAGSLAMLLLFGAAFSAVAAWRFRPATAKIGTT